MEQSKREYVLSIQSKLHEFNIDNVYYKLRKINSNKIILITHLGLGDQIILNGLVNYISDKFEKIILPVLSSNLKTIQFLYSENNAVDVVEYPKGQELDFIKDLSTYSGMDFLKIGFEKVRNKPFNLAFYSQLKLPYNYSFKYFHYPENKEIEVDLKEHLVDYYSSNSNEIILVHNESSIDVYDFDKVKINNPIYVTKESDKYENLFYYSEIIKEAKEIHCLDSSFAHLVERTDTKAKLYFHDLFGASIRLTKNWYYIIYEH
tara:strand:+ start:73 stop:858 length:786 start_codon:yes stop_codon:yes gene_type:complete